MTKEAAGLRKVISRGLARAKERVQRISLTAKGYLPAYLQTVEDEGGYYDQVMHRCQAKFQARMMVGSQMSTGWALMVETKGLQGVDVDEAQDWIELARSHLNSGDHFSVLSCEGWWKPDAKQDRTGQRG